MNDSPGWASPGSSPSGEPGRSDGPGAPQDAAPQNWSQQQPPAGQWQATGGRGVPPPPTGPVWGGPAPSGWQQPHWGAPPSPKPGVIPLRPLGMGEILDGAVSTMRAYWRTVLTISFAVSLLTQGAMLLVQGFMLDDSATINSLDEGADPSFGDVMNAVGGTLAAGGLALVITLLGSVIATAMLTMVISRAVLGHQVTLGEAWSDARHQLPRLFGLTLLLSLIGGGIIAIGIVPGVLVAVGGATAAGVGLAFLGGVVALGVVVWLMIRFSLASPALMLEKQGVLKSMARSVKLVRGSWWRILGIQLLTMILVYIVSSIIQIPFVVVGMVAGSDGLSAFASGNQAGLGWTYLIVIGIGAVIGSTITFPIQAGVTALLYMDQRIRREALDIELARAAGIPGHSDALGGAGAPGNSSATGS
ncbi:hypothetical protein OG539_18285 [Actinacidiphila glaucinigra]|uniref:DUF7544 domain-containing protein n=1 Tax=Actinacidiphila glaucinigra TaxID=235986 RepID=UPI002DD842B7|nr:hypothetical protein [Actinacidiphila glaucinigra]WSD61827.1 hypothetical protein OIE69_24490 [Actinacidiphila glaucinigra]